MRYLLLQSPKTHLYVCCTSSQTVPLQSPAMLAKYISHNIVCDMSTEVVGSTERGEMLTIIYAWKEKGMEQESNWRPML